MKYEKLVKIIATIAISLCLLFLAAFVGLVFLLPSASQIKGSFINSKGSPPAQGQHSNAQQTIGGSPQESSLSSANSPKEPESPESTESLKELEALMDERKPLSEACRTLRSMNVKQAEKMSSSEFGQRLQDSMNDKSSDPLMESFKPILKYTVQQPNMKDLIKAVMDAPTGEQDSLMGKAGFYNLAYKAYQEMMGNKKSMESILDRNYLTMMFGRVLEVRPELASDPQVLSYCEAIEKQLNEGHISDFGEEKRAFLDFLQEAQVDPKQIGFDSNYQTKLQVEFGKNGLHFKGGWLDEVFSKIAKKGSKEPPNENSF
jgi:hypothetical protein